MAPLQGEEIDHLLGFNWHPLEGAGIHVLFEYFLLWWFAFDFYWTLTQIDIGSGYEKRPKPQREKNSFPSIVFFKGPAAIFLGNVLLEWICGLMVSWYFRFGILTHPVTYGNY